MAEEQKTSINGVIESNAQHANLDSFYGPYPTTEDANNALADMTTVGRTIKKKKRGLTVGIETPDEDGIKRRITEYWFQGTDDNLQLEQKFNNNIDIDGNTLPHGCYVISFTCNDGEGMQNSVITNVNGDVILPEIQFTKDLLGATQWTDDINYYNVNETANFSANTELHPKWNEQGCYLFTPDTTSGYTTPQQISHGYHSGIEDFKHVQTFFIACKQSEISDINMTMDADGSSYEFSAYDPWSFRRSFRRTETSRKILYDLNHIFGPKYTIEVVGLNNSIESKDIDRIEVSSTQSDNDNNVEIKFIVDNIAAATIVVDHINIAYYVDENYEYTDDANSTPVYEIINPSDYNEDQIHYDGGDRSVYRKLTLINDYDLFVCSLPVVQYGSRKFAIINN